ncbi:MAG TPA: type II toxin-antitoxin system VapC family toxin [Phycicoccus sp.]|nr:type II toxin-antitoxin system VapC family toxin [Phycicoccus sp.]
MMGATCDTSVLVAALSRWHPGHAQARAALQSVAAIPDHCLLETYSVLTRLPPAHRVSPSLAGEVLTALPIEVISLSVDARKALVGRLALLRIRGGAVYDALVAETALEHGLHLVTLDARARSTYDSLGVRWRFL